MVVFATCTFFKERLVPKVFLPAQHVFETRYWTIADENVFFSWQLIRLALTTTASVLTSVYSLGTKISPAVAPMDFTFERTGKHAKRTTHLLRQCQRRRTMSATRHILRGEMWINRFPNPTVKPTLDSSRDSWVVCYWWYSCALLFSLLPGKSARHDFSKCFCTTELHFHQSALRFVPNCLTVDSTIHGIALWIELLLSGWRKAKVIAPINDNRSKQRDEPIIIRSNGL